MIEKVILNVYLFILYVLLYVYVFFMGRVEVGKVVVGGGMLQWRVWY